MNGGLFPSRVACLLCALVMLACGPERAQKVPPVEKETLSAAPPAQPAPHSPPPAQPTPSVQAPSADPAPSTQPASSPPQQQKPQLDQKPQPDQKQDNYPYYEGKDGKQHWGQ